VNKRRCNRNKRDMTKLHTLMMAIIMLGLTTAAIATTLAKQGEFSVEADELRLSQHALTDKEYERVTANPNEVRGIVAAILSARVYGKISTNPMDPRLQTLFIEKARLDHDVAQADRKAREWVEANDRTVLQRAREMFVAADAQSKQKPEVADFQHIFFDLTKRDFNVTADNIRAAQSELAAGADFTAVAKKYSDDGDADKTGGKLLAVPVASMDDTLRLTLLRKLNLDEVSQPIASRRGLHIVKLLKRPQAVAIEFEEVKEKFVQAVIDDIIASERKKIQRAIEAVPLVIDEEALTKFTRSPNPEQVKQVRQQVIEANREVKRQKARNLQSPMDAIK